MSSVAHFYRKHPDFTDNQPAILLTSQPELVRATEKKKTPKTHDLASHPACAAAGLAFRRAPPPPGPPSSKGNQTYKEMTVSLLTETGKFNISGAVVARPAGSAGQAAPGAPPVRRTQHETVGGARGNGRGARPGRGPAGLRGHAPVGGLEHAGARRTT